MNKTIYLDWNVFQDIFQKRRNLDLQENLEYWRDRKGYKIVFSSSHMQDLCKCTNDEYIRNDLALLSDLTKNWCVGLLENEVISIEQIDVRTVFEDIKKSIEREREELDSIGVKFHFNPYPVDISKLSEDNIILPFLDEGNILSPKAMERFVDSLKNDIFNNHDKQKRFRRSLKECVKINNPAFLHVLELPIYKYLLSTKQDIIENFFDIVNSFLSISGKEFNSIPIGERITTSYRILDFFPSFSERLNKRNNQSNISIDSDHLFFASDSSYLICGDEKMIEKAKIIYKLCGVKTRVLMPAEFMNITVV